MSLAVLPVAGVAGVFSAGVGVAEVFAVAAGVAAVFAAAAGVVETVIDAVAARAAGVVA